MSVEARWVDGPIEPLTTEAMNALRRAMQADPGYAWTFRCNIAFLLIDEGVSHERAHSRASSFMKIAFNEA